MREGHASRTAGYNAFFRALESSRPAGRRLFEDRLARVFLGPGLAFAARLGGVPGLRGLVARYVDARWPGVRTSLVARTRWIDDAIASGLGERVEQVVILGAGFDTRAYRMAVLRELPVFEVDHPDTLATRREALGRALGRLPERICPVAIDFAASDLGAVMAAAGYREAVRTFVLWEGVTNYLDEAAVDAALRWCARAAAGSPLLFTYVHRDILTRPDSFAGSRQLLAALARAGERFTFGIEPGELLHFLAERGLCLESDVGAAEYRERYYGAAARRMRGHEFYRVALARVSGRSSDLGAVRSR